MQKRLLPRLALGAALSLVMVTRSEVASAQFFAPGPSTTDASRVTWGLLLSGAALVPFAASGGGLADKKQLFSTAAGYGLFVPGVHLAMASTIALAFTDQEDTVFFTPMGGPFWSMAGVGLGRIISPSVHATWLGGAMGLSFFAFERGLMAQTGAADRPAASIMQATWAGIGGAGCIVDAAYSGGAERWAGIGCGVVSALTLAHGVTRAALGVTYGRKSSPSRALVPVPWAQRDAAGMALAGVW
jgi:hypothetical protein